MTLDAVVHLRVPLRLYERLEAIARGRAEGRLRAYPVRLHGLARELLEKGVPYDDPRPMELTGKEPTRVLHIRVPGDLLERLRSLAGGTGPRGAQWKPMPFSGYLRGRLWKAMLPEWSALPESRVGD